MKLQFPLLSDVSLKDFSTFGIGGLARYFIEVTDIESMQEALIFARNSNLDFHVVGKGSNSLFSDKGFDGLVIHNKISYCQIQGNEVEAGAGYSFSLLGVKTAKKDLTGLEFASGIPASVGGAVFMNAGANGQETADSLIEVGFIDENGSLMRISKKDLSFDYRHSSFHEKKGAIVYARFQLEPLDTARERQLSILDYRLKTQPYGQLSIGCIFRNPEGFSAGALIEKAGLKGLRIGGAEVSTLHANFIINVGEATAADVLALALKVKEKVKIAFDVDLELEVRCIEQKT